MRFRLIRLQRTATRLGLVLALLTLCDPWTIDSLPIAAADEAPSVKAAETGAQAGTKPAAAEELTADDRQFFEKEVRPLLIKHCYECHSSEAKKLKGGLHLDRRSGWMKGGDTGPAIVPFEPDKSLLIAAVRYESLQMPPQGKLPEAAIAILEKWVQRGAPDPRLDAGPATTTRSPLEEARGHWSFQPIVRKLAPQVTHAAWPCSDVDRFILAKLESEGLAPVADADKLTLVRRVFFDLLGVPPTVAEIAAFVNDDSPDAFAKLVDGLLGRTEFGPRWGRHWLDVARYADSNGSDENFTYYDAWRYRNYVIGAINADKPFDRFLSEQLAGDLLPYQSQEERDENILATGFLVVGPKVIGATDKQQLLVDVIDEQVDTIGKTFLGLTLGCARCHDHKFDPISARDYYALAGILQSTETVHGNLLNRRDLSGWNLHPLGATGKTAYDTFLAHEKTLDDLDKEQKKLVARAEAIKKGEQPVADSAAADKQNEKKKTEKDPAAGDQPAEAAPAKTELQQVEERLAALKQEITGLKKNPPPRPPLAMSVNDQERPGSMEICIRGDAHNRGETVPRGFIAIIASSPAEIGPNVSGRAELAAWLTSRDNPLTSRVAVNRVWHHLFGKGLVGSVDDFGTRGDRPTHPELLDHLASRFMEDGWSLKRLIRELVLSRTYRLSSNGNAEGATSDPENRWLWRMNRRRLQIESLRDGMLAIAGQLDPTPAESVVAHLSVQATGVGVKPNKVILSFRRTVYLPVVRNDLPTFLPLFDFGDSQTVNGRRSSTNVAPQALFMMNSPLVFEAATHAARRALLGNDGRSNDDLLELLFVQILGRPPRPAEVGPSLALIQAALAEASAAVSTAGSSTGGTNDNSAQVRAWAVLGQALFCSTSFQYLD